MEPESLKDYFLNKINNRDFRDLEGSAMKFHIPVKESLVNFILNEQVSGKVDGIRSVQLAQLDGDEFVVDLDHNKIGSKHIRCRIEEVDQTITGPKITIRFVDGLRFYEKAALDTFSAVKKGWGWFKSKMKDEEQEESEAGPGVKISGSKVVVHMGEMLRKKDMDYLVPLIRLERLSTQGSYFIIDVRIKV